MKFSSKACRGIVALSAITAFSLGWAQEDNPELVEKEAEIEHEKLVEEKKEEQKRAESLPMTPVERAATSSIYASKWAPGGSLKVKTQIGRAGVATYSSGVTVDRNPAKEFPIGLNAFLMAGTNFQQLLKSTLPHQSNITAYGYGLSVWTARVSVPLDLKKGILVSAGRIDPWVGLENSADSFGAVLSGGVLGDYSAYPEFHNGVFLTWPINKKLTTNFYLTAGWNEKVFDRKRKSDTISGGFYARYAPTDKTNVGLSWYVGREGVAGCPPRTRDIQDGQWVLKAFDLFGGAEFLYPGFTNVNLYNLYATHKITDKWTVGFDSTYATAGCPNRGEWGGGGIYVAYQPNKTWKFGLRADYLGDPDGLILVEPEKAGENCTIIPGKLLGNSYIGSVAAMAQYNLTTKSKVQLELRYNYSNRDIFNVGTNRVGDPIIRSGQFIVTLQQVYSL